MKRTTKKFTMAANTEQAVGNHYKTHSFQVSTSVDLTPVLMSGSDGEVQTIATGETWATNAPLRGFKTSAICTVYWAGDLE